MQRFVLLSIFGFAAQFVDGALGMAYGLTATSMLLAGGVAPAMASASVHLSEVGTTLVSGVAHWRFGNIEWRAVCWMALPGAVGAFTGAIMLTSIPAEAASIWIAAFLVCLGFYVLSRFTFRSPASRQLRRVRGRFLAPLGLGAGFLDAAGGGGWGPIATPTLLASGRMEPRKVIGTVDTSEFLVALGASSGFLIGLNRSDIPLNVVGALLLGGTFAAPLAAWFVRHIHPRLLGASVGGMIVVTNGRSLLAEFDISADVQYLTLLGAVVIWITALCIAIRAVMAERLARQAGVSGD